MNSQLLLQIPDVVEMTQPFISPTVGSSNVVAFVPPNVMLIVLLVGITIVISNCWSMMMRADAKDAFGVSKQSPLKQQLMKTMLLCFLLGCMINETQAQKLTGYMRADWAARMKAKCAVWQRWHQQATPINWQVALMKLDEFQEQVMWNCANLPAKELPHPKPLEEKELQQ